LLSGANIDANTLARVIQHVLVKQGRYLVLHTSLQDRPGSLAQLTSQIAVLGANVVEMGHRRAPWDVPVDRTGMEVVLEVRDEEHGMAVLRALRESGYKTRRVGAGEYPD
jgi:threonine dehydratase